MKGAGLEDLIRAARETAGAAAVDYCLGGAGDESTVGRNTAAIDRLVFVPRVLRAPGEPDLSVRVTGGELAAPLLVSPMGLQGLYHRGAEVETARAAASLGLGHCLSAFSSAGPAEVAAGAGPGLRWRQVYVLRDWELTRHLVEQAEEGGFRAVVCTVDVPVVGRRDRDRANGFDRFSVEPPAIVHSAAFKRLHRERGGDPRDVLDSVFPYPESTWDDVGRVIASTGLPVLVKGILHPDDARRAHELGAAGVIVSNHGGRQLDRCVSSIEALPAVHRAVGDVIPVYFDSGVRTGTHVALALALGARAVLVGRPLLLALAAGGEEQVAARLEDMVSDLGHTMRLVGAASPAGLRRINVLGTGPGLGPEKGLCS
ncbi:alpha-hydroxy acid oxidase [Actinomadura rubrisoli]|uniref:alpha-hydroxy acid oxidase n=1 Tax=Actinomadura rubrisoli TaxID=2530368 RepID=UPI001404C9EC|nr:alpha-hydroxy acid oxidase [Actinomadura rubrisoli]